jgi:hypothetical protein
MNIKALNSSSYIKFCSQGKAFIVVILLITLSCTDNRWKAVEIVSPDKQDTISVITINTKRYIFNGSSDKIPEKHARVDISDVSNLGDELGICWNKDGNTWKLYSFDSKFDYSFLDKTKFHIQKVPLLGEHNIPILDEYFEENCVAIYLKDSYIRPENGAQLIYRNSRNVLE